ncbi:MAG: ABC transporter transmembrane domain-containing protein, partial [Paludibacter sp.]|nr:ABC transporter transmembrane domain-containing protein [Paludibacter sp.]
MFKFISLLKRFIPPYKKYVFLSLLFNLLSTVFSLFSFAAVIPVLRILFKIEVVNKTYIVWTWSESMKEITAAIKNNLYYSIERLIELVGPNLALLYVGLFLVLMTAFKVGSSYFGSYFMIPIRTGVLRDLRNQLYKKIISLPIGFFTDERKGDIMACMTGDVGEVEASIMSSLDLFFKNPIMILIYLGVMFAMS